MKYITKYTILTILLLVAFYTPTHTSAYQSVNFNYDNQQAGVLSSLLNIFTNTSNAQTPDITTGLVGHWTFDETSGATIASDSSGNNNAGTLTNMDPATDWVTGQVGGALGFDGTDDYVSIPDYAFDQFTISTWVRLDVSPGWQTDGIFSSGGGATGNDLIRFELGGTLTPKMKFWMRTNGPWQDASIIADSVWTSNVWTNVMAIRRGTTLEMWIDGVQQADTATWTGVWDVGNDTRIGDYDGASGREWNGLIDDVRIYDRALTQTDIAELYTAGGGVPPPPVCTSFIYSGWGVCQSDSTQLRSVLTSSPQGCAGGSPVIIQSCEYTPSPPDTTPPSIPGNLQATVSSFSQIDLSWTASTDDTAVTGYNIYLDGSIITNVVNTTYSDTGLIPSTNYSYTVTAIDAAGNESGQSISDSTTTSSADCDTTLGNINVCQKPPAPTLPSAGGTYIDPTYGTEILRVTDRNDADTNTHPYSSDGSSFNADSTRFIIRHNPGGTKLYSLDTVNFTSALIGDLFPSGPSLDWSSIQWDSTDPDILYGVEKTTRKLYEYNISTQIHTLIKDFTTDPVLISAFTDLANATGGEQWILYLTKSADDRWFSFIVGMVDGGIGNENNLGVMAAYDRQTDTTYKYDLFANYGYKYIHSALIDKSGEFVFFGPKGGTNNNAKYVWNITAGTAEEILDGGDVSAAGHKAMGTRTHYAVNASKYRLAILKRDLTDPQNWTFVFQPPLKDWNSGSHYSLNHSDESTIFVSHYNGVPITMPWQGEIFQAFTNGLDLTKTRRLVHHRSEPGVGSADGYWSSPRASVSLDGKFVIYGSNWDGSPYIDVFILKVPPLSSPTTTSSPIGGTYYSTQSIALSTELGATTYYTVDNTIPTTNSTIYTTPISISQSTTLQFFSVDTANNTESVKTEIYIILTADLNSDTFVNSIDWSILNTAWGTNNPTVDLNNDSTINALDWSVMSEQWSI